MAIKIEASQRLTAGPLDTALKMLVQAIVDEDAHTKFIASGDEDKATAKITAEASLPLLVIDHTSAKALASMLARHPDACLEVRATGPGKIEIDLIED